MYQPRINRLLISQLLKTLVLISLKATEEYWYVGDMMERRMEDICGHIAGTHNSQTILIKMTEI